MSDFKAEMYQVRFWLGLHSTADNAGGTYTGKHRFPDSLVGFNGSLLLCEVEGRWEEGPREGRREVRKKGKRGIGNGRAPTGEKRASLSARKITQSQCNMIE